MVDEKKEDLNLRNENMSEAVRSIQGYVQGYPHKDSVFILEETRIKKLHHVCMKGLLQVSEAGHYRQVEVKAGDHFTT